jgi:phosphopantothenoylcysteine decarboxylase/phosphopantothenate--cysteine ligase
MKSGLGAKKILITSGPTSVAIDAMRVITNRSTGEMGRLIANICAAKGAKVTLLEGAVTTTAPLARGIKVIRFCFFDELERLMRVELKKRPQVVVHAAAVSDFSVKEPFKGKLSSGGRVTLELVPTRKLVKVIRKAAPEAVLVAFKFEPSLSAAVRKAGGLFQEAGCDLVVANAVDKNGYRGCLIAKDGARSGLFCSKKTLVNALAGNIL